VKRKGLLIAIEGIDGTGKSTQLQFLEKFLCSLGCKVVVTREPTDSRYGKRIRQLYVDRHRCTPEEELELFLADRRLHVDTVIAPRLDDGCIVLTDRYYYSTAAYQGAAGMDIDVIFARNSFAPVPDRVLLLTMEPEISMQRIQQGRGDELNDFEQLDQLTKVAQLFAGFTDSCICRIDAAQPFDRVRQDIEDNVAGLLKEKRFICP